MTERQLEIIRHALTSFGNNLNDVNDALEAEGSVVEKFKEEEVDEVLALFGK